MLKVARDLLGTGVMRADAHLPTARSRQRLQDYPSIAGPKCYYSVVGDGAGTTIPLGLQTVRGDTARHEVVTDGFGALLRELAIKS